MSTQRRKFQLDPHPDVPCPSPAWLLATLDHARARGFCPSQQEAIAWVLGTAEVDVAPVPTLMKLDPRSGFSVAVVWPGGGDGRLLEAHLFRTCDGEWRVRLCLCRDGELVVDEYPRHPGNLLRGMLAMVYPGVSRSDRGRR